MVFFFLALFAIGMTAVGVLVAAANETEDNDNG